MNIKIIFAILSSLTAIVCFIPYIRDIFKGKTKPHSYSWLIWTILQTIGVIIMLNSGAGIGASSLFIGVILCSFVFLLSLKHGTHNIKTFDVICLIGALVSVIIYIFLQNAVFSIIIISITDFIGFLPTIRKSYEEPETETVSTYFLSSISSFFALLAISFFSFTTSIYLLSLIITNGGCAILILARRKYLKNIPIK